MKKILVVLAVVAIVLVAMQNLQRGGKPGPEKWSAEETAKTVSNHTTSKKDEVKRESYVASGGFQMAVE
ncbi:MAG: hypothetical protein Q8P86_02205 [bacterium]|nr:hypothetical protein [bacterium]